jgi:hypothetical protein
MCEKKKLKVTDIWLLRNYLMIFILHIEMIFIICKMKIIAYL